MFCPLFLKLSVISSIILFFSIGLCFCFCLGKSLNQPFWLELLLNSLFPLTFTNKTIYFTGFILLTLFNLSSLLIYSFPLTTSFSFNFALAFFFWVSTMIFFFIKQSNVSVLLPNNSPWYLASFLCLVELVSISVRPITLCFRLLANMSAGHILLSLICKLTYEMWLLGILFGLLELMVCLVQSFVFFMLISVYLEESISH